MTAAGFLADVHLAPMAVKDEILNSKQAEHWFTNGVVEVKIYRDRFSPRPFRLTNPQLQIHPTINRLFGL